MRFYAGLRSSLRQSTAYANRFTDTKALQKRFTNDICRGIKRIRFNVIRTNVDERNEYAFDPLTTNDERRKIENKSVNSKSRAFSLIVEYEEPPSNFFIPTILKTSFSFFRSFLLYRVSLLQRKRNLLFVRKSLSSLLHSALVCAKTTSLVRTTFYCFLIVI